MPRANEKSICRCPFSKGSSSTRFTSSVSRSMAEVSPPAETTMERARGMASAGSPSIAAKRAARVNPRSTVSGSSPPRSLRRRRSTISSDDRCPMGAPDAPFHRIKPASTSRASSSGSPDTASARSFSSGNTSRPDAICSSAARCKVADIVDWLLLMRFMLATINERARSDRPTVSSTPSNTSRSATRTR